MDDQGNEIRPAEPNGIKFEKFIFDLLPAARRAIVVEVERDSYFAPLKNPSGSPQNSPEKVQEQMAALHRHWLESAGAKVNDGITVEIMPAFASNQNELSGKNQLQRSI